MEYPLRMVPLVIGYVVLSRRPNPYSEDGWDYTIVSDKVFTDAREAENARDYRNKRVIPIEDSVEYVVGEIDKEWQKRAVSEQQKEQVRKP